MPEGKTRATGALRPIELATASVMAGVAVVLTVIGWFLPHLGFIAVLAVVPLGVVAYHHRFRALVASMFAAALVSFLVAGTGTLSNVVECAVVGGLIGISRRRGWSFLTVMVGCLVAGPALGAVSVGLLAAFSSLRKLTLEQIRNTWSTIRHVLDDFPQVRGAVRIANHWVDNALRDWWITVGVLVALGTLSMAVLGWFVLGAVLERLRWIRATDRLDAIVDDRPPGPVPVALDDVSYRYPGVDVDALTGLSLNISPGELIALFGDNGSGKSTLARVLAGNPPTAGRVTRPGAAALGRAGGTAMIMQHPETQILGVRVVDDVVWGLRDERGVDVPALLEAVGLGGMENRETSTLSGGELQRLAVAAGLARRPGLLISDESTAMVDEEGRHLLMSLLHDLPRQRDMAVVHITHRKEEASLADRTLTLKGGRVAPDPVEESGSVEPLPMPPGRPFERFEPTRLELVRVSHTYGIGSPWAQSALFDVNLSIEPGEGVLIVGGNGSGKSTLAWIMAGVLNPSLGVCLLGGRPVRSQVGSVGLAFQHARLQLQRARVGSDVRAAGAEDDEAVVWALAEVGLDANEFGERRIDELSGGQQRRVALAGLLARRPSVLVLDEPLAGLDGPSQDGLLDVLARLRHEQGLSVVVISHDLTGVERVCDRVVRIEGGRIAADDATAKVQC